MYQRTMRNCPSRTLKCLPRLDLKEEGVLLTDDYAVQNVASMLGIKVEPVVQKKIKDVLIWQKVCIGCKRKFDSGDICPVCGSPMRKGRKRKL